MTSVEAERYLSQYLWVAYQFTERMWPEYGSMLN